MKRKLINSKPHAEKKGLLFWGGLFCIPCILHLAARVSDGFAEWYALHIYPLLVGSVGRLFSLFPFSVIELLLYLAGGLLLAGTGAMVLQKLRPSVFAAAVGKTAVVLFLLFTLNCGINYQRETFARRAGFEIRESSVEELRALCERLVEEINEEASRISTDAQGHCTLEGDVGAWAREAMEAASAEYPELKGYYPRPKPVISTWYLSYQLLQGVYSPFTVEANYNNGMPDHDKPSTICHELSHLKGFMREDEANFIAYLACRASEVPEFRYSGSILAYIYSGNALYRADPEALLEVREQLCDQAVRDLLDHNAYWDQYRGTVAEVSDKMNDAYLKANDQEDGTKSYGRMVDLLLALNREEQ